MDRANGERPYQKGATPSERFLRDLEADALNLAQLASKAEEQARDARRQADLARDRVERFRADICVGQDCGCENESAPVPFEVVDELTSEIRKETPDECSVIGLIAEVLRRTGKQAGVRAALGKNALIPYADCLEAAGISREVGDRLREEGAIEVIIVSDSKNPRLYVTAGAWAEFIRRRKVADPPSKSKLSKAKRKKRTAR